MTRPTKLTPARQKRIVELLAKGNYRTTAARAAGVDPSTMRAWMSKEQQPYIAFQAAVEKAEAQAEAELVGIVHAAAPDNYRAALEMLARKFPTRWGARSFSGQLNSEGQPIDSENPCRVLIAPPHIDDIHEWSRRSKKRTKQITTLAKDPDINSHIS